eukprot:2642983-Prymnesium_polylepis.1
MSPRSPSRSSARWRGGRRWMRRVSVVAAGGLVQSCSGELTHYPEAHIFEGLEFLEPVPGKPYVTSPALLNHGLSRPR